MTNMSPADADYYREYIALCDEFIETTVSKTEASQRLEALNAKYEPLVGPQTLRDTVIGDRLINRGFISDLSEAWESSSYNC